MKKAVFLIHHSFFYIFAAFKVNVSLLPTDSKPQERCQSLWAPSQGGLLVLHLVDVVEFRAGPPAVVGLLPQPLGPHLHPAATGLAASRPAGPRAQLAVRRAGDDAGLLDVACGGDQRELSHVLHTRRHPGLLCC